MTGRWRMANTFPIKTWTSPGASAAHARASEATDSSNKYDGLDGVDTCSCDSEDMGVVFAMRMGTQKIIPPQIHKLLIIH